jgi:hypothetical protein
MSCFALNNQRDTWSLTLPAIVAIRDSRIASNLAALRLTTDTTSQKRDDRHRRRRAPRDLFDSVGSDTIRDSAIGLSNRADSDSWGHIAIDLFTGKVVDKQIEVVNE